MPTPILRPDLDTALEVTGNVVSAAIQSGKLSCEVKAVMKYFAELYPRIVNLRHEAK